MSDLVKCCCSHLANLVLKGSYKEPKGGPLEYACGVFVAGQQHIVGIELNYPGVCVCVVNIITISFTISLILAVSGVRICI